MEEEGFVVPIKRKESTGDQEANEPKRPLLDALVMAAEIHNANPMMTTTTVRLLSVTKIKNDLLALFCLDHHHRITFSLMCNRP